MSSLQVDIDKASHYLLPYEQGPLAMVLPHTHTTGFSTGDATPPTGTLVDSKGLLSTLQTFNSLINLQAYRDYSVFLASISQLPLILFSYVHV